MSAHKQQQTRVEGALMRSYNLRRHPHLATFHAKINQHPPHAYHTLNHSLNSSSVFKHEARRENESTQGQKDSEIYFNRTKKYNYMKNIIDTYFQEGKKDKQTSNHSNNPEDADLMKHSSTIIPKIFKNKPHDDNQEQRDLNNQIKNRGFLISKRRNKINANSSDTTDELKDSLAQSRLVEANQTHHGNQITRANSLWSKNTTTILPPINQMLEDKDDCLLGHYDSISYINESSTEPNRQERMVMIENEIYRIEMMLVNGRPSYKIKTFKEKGAVIMERELRAKTLGTQPLWIEYKYDPRCLISPNNSSLKDLLFKVKPMDIQSKFLVLKPKKYYKKLLANNCEQLKRILVQFCIFMKKFDGKLVNNKINLSNLFLTKTENMRLGQWGFASFRETHLIQSMEFQNRIEPIIKSEKEWFIPPEYLAPEIMHAIVAEDQNVDLMSYGSATDIWSLGLAILEMLTVIPVWIPQKCVIYSKSSAPRTGLLALPDRDLKKLLKKQQKLGYLVQKLIEDEYQDEKINPSVLQVLYRCLDFHPASRATYSDIIELLK